MLRGRSRLVLEGYLWLMRSYNVCMLVSQSILVQEFIKEAGGADMRCFVIGDKVVAAMKRQAKEGEFRSNLHRGGTASLMRITPEERSTAVRAAQTMGLNVAVDQHEMRSP